MSKQILTQARKQLADLEDQIMDEDQHEDDRAPISLGQAAALNKSGKKKKNTFKLREDLSDDDDQVL